MARDESPNAGFFEPADSSWRDDAACQHADPELFYPEPGDADTAARAVAVCRTCPVIEPCLSDALDTRERFGIRGGLTPRHRDALLLGRRSTTQHVARNRTAIAARGHEQSRSRVPVDGRGQRRASTGMTP